jgi:hypothetical protein
MAPYTFSIKFSLIKKKRKKKPKIVDLLNLLEKGCVAVFKVQQCGRWFYLLLWCLCRERNDISFEECERTVVEQVFFKTFFTRQLL